MPTGSGTSLSFSGPLVRGVWVTWRTSIQPQVSCPHPSQAFQDSAPFSSFPAPPYPPDSPLSSARSPVGLAVMSVQFYLS